MLKIHENNAKSVLKSKPKVEVTPPKTKLPIPNKVANHENVKGEYSRSQPCVLKAGNPEGTLDDLANLRSKHKSNPIIGYVNINSLRGDKLNQLKIILHISPIDILCIDETKLTSNFPDAQFLIEGYQHPPIRRDRSAENQKSMGGGKLVYIKDGLVAKRVTNYETPTAETICVELSIAHRKWLILFAYRPESINRNLFFAEINMSLSKALKNFQNILTGDLNVNMDQPANDVKGYLSDICDTYNLTNLIKSKTCTKKKDGSSIDVLLTTCPKSFCNTCVIETGLSDYHKLIMTFLKCKFERIPPKIIYYRKYKNFKESMFLKELASISFKNVLKENSPYDTLQKNLQI